MPDDLLIAVAGVVAGSLALTAGGRAAARRSRWGGTVLALLAVFVLVTHAVWLKDSLLLPFFVQSADVIVWGNVAMPAAGLLAGVCLARLPGARWQRFGFAAAIGCIGVWRLIGPLVGSPPPLSASRVVDGVCRQSTTSTCAAAAATTLLLANGVNTSEAEMSRLCLTHTDGTTNLGLYRGIKLKADGSGRFKARAAGGMYIGELLRWHLPAVVLIRQKVDDRWLSIGNRHAVVLLGVDQGQLMIADPFAGKQRWTVPQLNAVFTGDAITLFPMGQK